MDILFLGTSAGTPSNTRNVSGVALIEDKGRAWSLIDCGEGTQHQLLRSSLSLNDLQQIFITHVHGDHCYGLPGLLASAALHGRKNDLPIVAPQGIEEWLRASLHYTAQFLPFALRFVASESLRESVCGNFTVSSIALSHRVASFAYCFVENHRSTPLDREKLLAERLPQGPLWGMLQKGEDVHYADRVWHSRDYLKPAHQPRRIIICGDNDRPELLSDVCHGCDVLVHEATYTEAVHTKTGSRFGHSTAHAIAAFAEALALPHLILTHFSPRYRDRKIPGASSHSIYEIEEEARAVYRGALYLARDFARYRLNHHGTLVEISA